ncbi:ATP-dependent nuclease [Ureibacillus manganicus]|uniref:ATP-dependent endonuclease n=1 Tax=Ureibacillus manganicus DSM 26584 TaxID=1384049 RepID=A0A0A3IJE9_9BACL|nr:AAA family ATPase [Ureibacillus manganicus]KGR75002.1 ATP-dependent endonuclease [Ureibacillus manganicus DSM 26584]
MYISKLSVKNYRNFGEGKFSIPLKPFTAIIGENNIGKSNLIDCIGLVLSQDITMFKKRFLDVDDINSKTKEIFKNSVVNLIEEETIDESKIKFPDVRVELILDELDEDQLAVVGDWFYEKTFTKAKLTYWFKPRAGFKRQEWVERQVVNLRELLSEGKVKKEELYHHVEFPIDQYEYIIFGGNNPTNKCDPYFLKMLKLEVLDALRDAKKELVANGEYKLLYRILNRNYENDFVEIQSLLGDLNQKLKENKKLETIKKELTTYLDRVSLSNPSELNSIDFNFSSPEVNEILKKLSIVYGENPVSIERNGLGKNNLLFISLVLSHLASQTDEKTKLAFRVIGIEEPEAHLHPHLQTHLAKNLSKVINLKGEGVEKEGEKEEEEKKDTQIIITSHSTNITTSIDLDNLVILYRDKDQIKYHYILDGFSDKKEGQDHIKYLKKYLDATNSSMFYARRLILVEGISEQILVPLFFELYSKKTLESIGSNIINVNGVAFRHFLEIIKNGYFIKCGVLTDKDAGKKTEKRAEKLKEHYKINSDVIAVEINDDTFEKEIIKYNLKDKGRELLLKVFKQLHPIKYTELEKSWEKQIDVKTYFENIENDKSDFAFALHEELLKDSTGFIIPKYIVSIFKFILGEENEEQTK